MKKYLTFIIAVVLVSTPLFANASWWNPIDWFSFIFHKPAAIERIVEIPTSTSTGPVSIKIGPLFPTTTTEATTSAKKKIIVPAPQSEPKNVQPTGNLCKGTYYANCPTGNSFICPASGAGYCEAPKTDNQRCTEYYGSNSLWNGQRDANGTGICDCKTGFSWNKQVTSCVSNVQYCADKWPNSSWDGTFDSQGKFSCTCAVGYEPSGDKNSCQKSQTAVEKFIEQQDQAQKDKQQAASDRENSPECVSAKTALAEVNNRINAENKSYNDQKDNIRNNNPTGQSASGQQIQLNQLETKHYSTIANLSIESMPLNDKYYLACKNFVATPSKIYNTNCYGSGDTMNCTTY